MDAELAASRARIDEALSLQCRSSSECATLPIGHRACGGPEGYLAYSTATSDIANLVLNIGRYTQRRKQLVEASAEMSTCQVPVDPGAYCTPAGQCQLQPTRGGRGTSPVLLPGHALQTAVVGDPAFKKNGL
jgi:hypothetical protein